MPTLLKPDLAIRGDKASGTARVLIDTGAEASFIRRSVAEQLGTLGKLPIPMRILFGDSSQGNVTEGVRLALDLAGQIISDDFVVMDTLVEDIVLGAGTLRRYALKVDMGAGSVYAAIASDITTEPKTVEPSVTLPEKETLMNEQLKALCATLNIATPESMTDEQAMAAIIAKTTPAAPPAVAAPAVLAALGVAADATIDQVHGKILSLTHRADVVPVAELHALKVQLHERDKKDALEAAILAGKLAPAEKEVWKAKLDSGDITLATFNAFIVERPKVSPLGTERPKEQEQKGTLAAVQMDDVQRDINRQLGLSDEVFRKYYPQPSS